MNPGSNRSGEVLDGVALLIKTGPGRTELELTRALFGEDALWSRVSWQCRRLIAEGRVCRKGLGNRREPYRYYPAGTAPEESDRAGGNRRRTFADVRQDRP